MISKELLGLFGEIHPKDVQLTIEISECSWIKDSKEKERITNLLNLRFNKFKINGNTNVSLLFREDKELQIFKIFKDKENEIFNCLFIYTYNDAPIKYYVLKDFSVTFDFVNDENNWIDYDSNKHFIGTILTFNKVTEK